MKALLVSILFAVVATVGFIYTSTTTIHAGTERVDLTNSVQVIVFSTDKEGTWHSRVGNTQMFSDAVIIACFEWPNSTLVSCLLIVKETGETLMMQLRLKELKT